MPTTEKTIVQATENITFTFDPKTIDNKDVIEVSFWVNGKCSKGDANTKVGVSELKAAKHFWVNYLATNPALYIGMATDNDEQLQQAKHKYYMKQGFYLSVEFARLNKLWGNRLLELDTRV